MTSIHTNVRWKLGRRWLTEGDLPRGIEASDAWLHEQRMWTSTLRMSAYRGEHKIAWFIYSRQVGPQERNRVFIRSKHNFRASSTLTIQRHGEGAEFDDVLKGVGDVAHDLLENMVERASLCGFVFRP